MEKVRDRATHLMQKSSWDAHRITKLVFGVLCGAVGGGAVSLGALSSISQLKRVMSSNGQIALILAGSGLGGTLGGAFTLYSTSPEREVEIGRPTAGRDDAVVSSTVGDSGDPDEEQSSSESVHGPTSSSSSSVASHDTDGETSINESDSEEEDPNKVRARALVEQYAQIEKSDGKEAAEEWLRSSDGPVEAFLNSVTLTLRLRSPKGGGQFRRKATLVRNTVHTILNSLVPPESEGKQPQNPSQFMLRRAVAYYQTLVDAFGKEMAALIVGDTYPILGMGDEKTYEAVCMAKQVSVNDHIASEHWKKVCRPKVEDSVKAVTTLVQDIWVRGSLVNEYKDELLRHYKRLHDNLGEDADEIVSEALEISVATLYADIETTREIKTHLTTLDRVRDQVPLRLFMENGTPKIEYNWEVCNIIAGEVDARDAQYVDPAKDQFSREHVTAKRFADLEKLEGDDMSEGIESPFSEELWNIGGCKWLAGRPRTGKEPAIKGLYQLKLNHSEADNCLQPEHFETIKQDAGEAENELRQLVIQASEKLPEGYDAPLREVSNELIAKWQQMAALVTLGEGEAWDAARQTQYATVYREANAQMVELKQVMKITEEYIGIDENFCEELAMLFYGISQGVDRESLREVGEEFRTFLMHRNGQLKRSIGGGREGVMPVLLNIFHRRLEAVGVSHPQLQLRTDTRGVKEKEDWVPVAWGLSTYAERVGNLSAYAPLWGNHFVNYVRTGNAVTRLDNTSRARQAALERVHVYEPEDQKAVQRGAIKLYGSEAILFVHRDVEEEVLEALGGAGEWSTLRFGGNNCFISSAAVLLTAYFVAGHALDEERFVMDPEWIEEEAPASPSDEQTSPTPVSNS